MARVNTKQLITEAAVRVAAQYGISGASMDQIAEAAGVAKGSLYYNFASKDAIFEEVIRDGFARLAAAIDEARVGAPAADGPRAVAAATLETLRGNLDLAKLMASEVFRTDRPWAGTMELARSSVVVRFTDVLRAAERRAPGGAALSEITETAGAAFFGALAGACLDWLLFRSDQPVELVLDQVLRAFAAPPASAAG
ncbi:TetR/AcrR family transcriptional regulator [Leucobacter luti]|uniref:TetR family transcriptional regulator n=1 Tax=Leucobacter luti TaxID=340320 RepID=A0A4Q7TQ49_9MICO|nr:TetR/AcrR family transcriptional regulator [Leucobacter luti]MBL3699790.1 TetR/AcrR family transcriptional regulator [Leucobacter luti]RZT62891.1 TetR family transcriptional regulator [Leucobacter luti]